MKYLNIISALSLFILASCTMDKKSPSPVNADFEEGSKTESGLALPGCIPLPSGGAAFQNAANVLNDYSRTCMPWPACAYPGTKTTRYTRVGYAADMNTTFYTQVQLEGIYSNANNAAEYYKPMQNCNGNLIVSGFEFSIAPEGSNGEGAVWVLIKYECCNGSPEN